MRIFNNKKVRVAIFILVGLGLFTWYFYFATGKFIGAYTAYATLSLEEENIVYIPAQPDNPTRREMNQMLAEVLSGNLPNEERLKKAQRGLVLVSESAHVLDPIQDRGGNIDQAIQGMRNSMMPFTSFSSFGREEKILALAERRADIVSDIRALTVRANFETEKIFRHVVDEGGRLSESYVLELNAGIPEVEAQYNMKTALYAELGTISDSIVKEYLELSVFGLPIHGK